MFSDPSGHGLGSIIKKIAHGVKDTISNNKDNINNAVKGVQGLVHFTNNALHKAKDLAQRNSGNIKDHFTGSIIGGLLGGPVGEIIGAAAGWDNTKDWANVIKELYDKNIGGVTFGLETDKKEWNFQFYHQLIGGLIMNDCMALFGPAGIPIALSVVFALWLTIETSQMATTDYKATLRGDFKLGDRLRDGYYFELGAISAVFPPLWIYNLYKTNERAGGVNPYEDAKKQIEEFF